MRRLVLLVAGALVLVSFGCKREVPEPKKMPPRRLLKPGEGGGGAKPIVPNVNPSP